MSILEQRPKPEPKTEPSTAATPWGRADTVTHHGEGLDFYTTPGHGGLHLSPRKWDDLRACFDFKPYAGPQWLEEDEDANLAVIRWPECFSNQWVYFACRAILEQPDRQPRTPRAWLVSDAGLVTRQIAAAFAEEVKNKWERGCMVTKGGGWRVWFSKSGAQVEAFFKDYPEQVFYSDEELAPFAAAAGSTLHQVPA